MFCPSCGRALSGPAKPNVPFPMGVCAVDGVVYDERRGKWYGLPEVKETLHCPGCGTGMEGEPKSPPIRVFVCFQCGITFDRNSSAWYGLAYHSGSPG